MANKKPPDARMPGRQNHNSKATAAVDGFYTP
jgi:hypothetical protein